MKHFTFSNFSKSLMTRLALVAMMIVGGGSNVWADELTIHDGSTVNYYYPFANANLNTDGVISEFIISKDVISVLVDKQITGLTFYSNQTTGNYPNGVFRVYIEEVSSNAYDSSNYSSLKYAPTTVYEGNLSVANNLLVINFTNNFTYSDNTKNLIVGVELVTQPTSKPSSLGFYVTTGTTNSSYCSSYNYAKQIKPKVTIAYDVPVTSTLTISPDEDADFGTVWEDSTKTGYYTITNNTASTVNVAATISGTDAASFSISPSEAKNIASGETQTYSISYTYDSESLGEKAATITFTTDDDETNAITKNITATAISDNAPQLSITPDEDSDLGSVYSGSTTYTVTNIGTGSLSVNIASDNSDFVVDNTSIENLTHGDSGTFTVTYTFAATADKLGVNSANITVTPTYDDDDAKTYEVSATSNATFTLDEDHAWETGPGWTSKKYLHVKYTPSNEWNTICMPFVLRNNDMDNMTIIFGEGWTAFQLSSYNDGALTFSKISSSTVIQGGTPYLVYIKDAANHPEGVLLSDISTTGNTPSKTEKGGATFQGTYVTKEYNEETDETSPWYGVTPAGRIMKAGTDALVKGYRAYFTGVSAPDTGAEVKMFIIGGGDIPTDLGFVKMVDADATDVYNLAGQKVQKGRKGIYIVNGKKVVIK